MPKYNVMVECRNAGGTDLHCWRVDASFEPVRTEAVR